MGTSASNPGLGNLGPALLDLYSGIANVEVLLGVHFIDTRVLCV